MGLINRTFSEQYLPSFFVHAARIPYALLKLLPTRNKVVLISRNNTKTSIDFQLLEREIKRQSPGTKVVILNHYMQSKLKHIRDILVEMYHLATSRGCIIDSYVIAVSILHHKKNLVIIQIWHALGAIKQFGYMTLGKKAGHSERIAKIMNMHGNYTYVTCGSEATKPIFARTFGVSRRVIKPIGEPRVDYLLDSDTYQANRQIILSKYPGLKGKKVVLYAPTFRRGHRIHPSELIRQFDLHDYALIIKQHRLDKTKLPKSDSIIQIKDEFDSLELLPIADYVVTDYSALTFEAALLHKPLYFWTYDYDTYTQECGLAMDYQHEMPGIIAKRAKTIADAIKHNRYSPRKIAQFANKWIAVQDGTCTKKIVGLLGL